jgi:hypothetical protein
MIALSLAGVAVVLVIGWWAAACLSDRARQTTVAEEFLADLDAEADRWR